MRHVLQVRVREWTCVLLLLHPYGGSAPSPCPSLALTALFCTSTNVLLLAKGGLHPPTWPNDSPAPWQTEIGSREVVVQDWVTPSLLNPPQRRSPPTRARSPTNRLPSTVRLTLPPRYPSKGLPGPLSIQPFDPGFFVVQPPVAKHRNDRGRERGSNPATPELSLLGLSTSRTTLPLRQRFWMATPSSRDTRGQPALPLWIAATTVYPTTGDKGNKV